MEREIKSAVEAVVGVADITVRARAIRSGPYETRNATLIVPTAGEKLD